MSRIYPICSSSGGNSTFIGTRGHGIIVDAGCSFRAMKNALSLIDTKLDESGVEAVFITHEHGDHIKGVEQLIKQTKIPIFASSGTIEALFPNGTDARVFDASEGYHSADFEVSAFRTSHDCAMGLGYRIRFGEDTFGVCTDTGIVTAEAERALSGCKTVLLESNYDEEMLRKNLNYPPDLKRRISGEFGHLSNKDCAEFALRLVKSGTKHIVLGHLSRENNTPNTAKSCVENYLSENGFIAERDYTLFVAPVTTAGEYIAV